MILPIKFYPSISYVVSFYDVCPVCRSILEVKILFGRIARVVSRNEVRARLFTVLFFFFAFFSLIHHFSILLQDIWIGPMYLRNLFNFRSDNHKNRNTLTDLELYIEGFFSCNRDLAFSFSC